MLTAIIASTVLLTAPQVVDGDTVKAGGAVYRLVNIDAPETGPRAQCQAERDLGRAATRRAREAVRTASRVEVRLTGRQDRYGREVAAVLVDGADLGGLLMREGLAQPWRGRKAAWCG